MYAKIMALFFFMALLSGVFSAELSGIVNPDWFVEKEDFPNEGKTVFIITGAKVFYDSNVSITAPDPNTKYYLKISKNTKLMPVKEFYARNQLQNYVIFDSSISGLIIDGILSTSFDNYYDYFNSYDSLDLIIEGDVNVIIDTGTIESTGAKGFNGYYSGMHGGCNGIFSAKNASEAGNIEIKGTVFVSENSTVSLMANGGKGGNGVDGNFLWCGDPDGSDAGNATKAGNIKLNNLVLTAQSSAIFSANGGNAGKPGKGDATAEGIKGEDGLAESAGKIEIESINLSEEVSESSQGNPEIGFSALRGTGINRSLLHDGNVFLRGCDLSGRDYLSGLSFVEAKAERITVFSNSALSLLYAFQRVCFGACRTFFQLKVNVDCVVAESETERNAIFSLTGTVKKDEQNLSGDFSDFVLSKDLAGVSEEVARTLPSENFGFSGGLFNFSFGFNQSIFSSVGFDFSSGFNPFTYLLGFMIDTVNPDLSDFSKAGFVFEEYGGE